MIYKFIDNNGSEITVNSLSSLQALVESETVKKKTKVKAGLRGKWTTAENITELVFEQEKQEETEEAVAPEGDIKSFITNEEEKPLETADKEEETIEEKKPEKDEDDYEYVEEEVIEEVEVDEDEEKNEESSGDYYTDNEEKKDSKYDDENVIGLNFFQAIGTCLRKYFVIKGRASRSEYWFLQLIVTPTFTYLGWAVDPIADGYGQPNIFFWISLVSVFVFFIPAITCQIRRFHDINKSGWFILINFIPFVGWIIALVMLVGKGTEGKNRFGDYPLKLKRR